MLHGGQRIFLHFPVKSGFGKAKGLGRAGNVAAKICQGILQGITFNIGQKAWRAFHYTAYLAFLLALVHGIMAGSDSASPAMRALYLLTGGTSVFLLLYGLLAYAPRPPRASVPR